VVPYCLRRLLLCPFGTRYGLVFSGRPAGRPVYAPLCGRAAPPPGASPARSPRLAAPLLGPRVLARIAGPPLLDHRGGGRLHSATPACGAAAGGPPGSRPAPRRSAYPDRGLGYDPWSTSPRSPWLGSSSPRHGCARRRCRAWPGARRRRRARARRPARGPTTALPGPAGRLALTAPSAVLHAALRARGRLGRRDADDARRDHCMGGGRVLRPPWSPPPAGGGRGRGRAPTRQAPCWPGTEGEESGAVPISLHPGCARCAASSSQHYASRLG
jgi:hypothetical protein